MDALKYYLSKNNRRLTFEYLLLSEVNDTQEANELVNLLRVLMPYIQSYSLQQR